MKKLFTITHRDLHFNLLLVVLVISVRVHPVAVLGPVHGDALHVLVVPGPGSRPALGPGGPGHGQSPGPGLGAAPADGEPPRVVALAANDLREYPSPCIDEPVTHLEDDAIVRCNFMVQNMKIN